MVEMQSSDGKQAEAPEPLWRWAPTPVSRLVQMVPFGEESDRSHRMQSRLRMNPTPTIIYYSPASFLYRLKEMLYFQLLVRLSTPDSASPSARLHWLSPCHELETPTERPRKPGIANISAPLLPH